MRHGHQMLSVFQCPTEGISESLGKVVSEQVTEGLGTLRGPCAGAKLGADDQQKGLSQGDGEGDTKRAKHSPRPGKAKNV